MSEDLYDINVLVRKIWEPTRNCLRNNFFSSLPPYDADQFARIQGTDDNYMKGYLIKRKYQLFLSQMLQLVMIGLYVNRAVISVKQSNENEFLTRSSVVSLSLLNFSIILIKIIEWFVLSLSLYHANHVKTLTYSHGTLFSIFVIRLLYLYLPYRDMIEFESDGHIIDEAAKYLLEFINYIFVYINVLQFLLPNIMLLRAAKKATFYLSHYYDNVTKDDYFYYVHFVLTWIYVLTVSITYGIAYVIVHYVIWYDENHWKFPGLGLDGYLKEEYVPILWMIWFLSAMFELAPRKNQCSCLFENLALMCNIMWWVITLVVLYYLKMLGHAIGLILMGYAQYYQLKLQLRDFFVALEYRRRTNARPHYGGERVVEMLHIDPPTMPMDIQSDGASPTAVHIPISAAGYQKVEEAS